MKKFIQGMYQKKNFGVRLTAVILSVIVMGFALSLLVLVDLGTDPCTSMNLAISEKIGMGIGNWQALLNTIIFVFVILLGRENIGFGTLANMFLVGYTHFFISFITGLPPFLSIACHNPLPCFSGADSGTGDICCISSCIYGCEIRNSTL